MYLKAHAHEAAASQPLFSRAVQPAQRGATLSERRKRKAPAALAREQAPQVRRTQKHACVVSAPPAHVRVAKAPAGPYHTLHRCVDVRTREVFFFPEYTGPAGEEELHAVQWPTVIALPSPTARNGAAALASANYATDTSDATDASPGDHHTETTPGPETTCDGSTEAGVAEPRPTLLERRQRKALSPLRLDIIPPFRRRNTDQICVLEAPATHVRLHAVQAGPHHIMHQCIDAHTEEVFFLPEYVGPSGEQSAHRISWPQTINTAPKAPEHQQDVPFTETLDRDAVVANTDGKKAAEGGEGNSDAGSLTLLSSTSAYSPCSTSSTCTCFTSCASSVCPASSHTDAAGFPTTKALLGGVVTECSGTSVASFNKDAAGIGGGVDKDAAGMGGGVDAGNGGMLAAMHGGTTSTCSPWTPCDVAVATASLAARAVKVN